MIVLGRISAPFGVRGWIRVRSFGGDAGDWAGMPCWWLSADADAPLECWQAHRLLDCKPQGTALVASLAGVADRTAAAALGGLYIGAPRSALPDTAENEYYWADLIGLAVVNQAGESLGHVASLIATGAHDVLCVRDDEGRERLLPCVAAVVAEVDVAGRLVRVAWERDW